MIFREVKYPCSTGCVKSLCVGSSLRSVPAKQALKSRRDEKLTDDACEEYYQPKVSRIRGSCLDCLALGKGTEVLGGWGAKMIGGRFTAGGAFETLHAATSAKTA